MTDTTSILNIVQSGGVVGLLIVILVGGMKQWWVWGWQYEQARKEIEEWKVLALKGTRVAEAVANIVEAEKGK